MFEDCFNINHLILAIESAQLGVKVGDDMVPGLMSADDVVGVAGTAEGLQGTNQMGPRIHEKMKCDSES